MELSYGCYRNNRVFVFYIAVWWIPWHVSSFSSPIYLWWPYQVVFSARFVFGSADSFCSSSRSYASGLTSPTRSSQSRSNWNKANRTCLFFTWCSTSTKTCSYLGTGCCQDSSTSYLAIDTTEDISYGPHSFRYHRESNAKVWRYTFHLSNVLHRSRHDSTRISIGALIISVFRLKSKMILSLLDLRWNSKIRLSTASILRFDRMWYYSMCPNSSEETNGKEIEQENIGKDTIPSSKQRRSRRGSRIGEWYRSCGRKQFKQ